jgi:biopolymer transport protein ExbD
MIKIYHRTNSTIDDPQLDFTSMLDVIFIILIFTVLMINSSSLLEIKVKLPTGYSDNSANINEKDYLLIEITSDGKYSLEGKGYLTVKEVKSYLLKINSQKQLKIACDENAAAKHLVELLATLNDIEISMSEILLKKH